MMYQKVYYVKKFVIINNIIWKINNGTKFSINEDRNYLPI